MPEEPSTGETAARREAVITASREKYATPRAEVEALLYRDLAVVSPTPAKVTKKKTAPAAEQPPAEPGPAEEPAAPKPAPPPPVVQEARLEPAPTAEPIVRPVPKPPPEKSVPAEPSSPADMGRGGAQHQAIQQRLKQTAEGLGFRSTIEKPTPEGGSVDLFLERGDTVIAGEISITTTIDHEVGNVAKCLKAGYPVVMVICLEPERLRKIAAAVRGSLGAEAADRVQYLDPEAFIRHLKAIPVPVPKVSASQVATRHGYKIKRTFDALSAEEKKRRETEAIKSIAETMRLRKGGGN